MGIVFASPSSDQLFTLSESILENANDTTNEHLQILQNIFTSCAENNKKEEINQLCTSFLEKSFPLLEAKRRTYREEELQIPLSGEIQTREIGPLSPEQVQKLVGISQALS
ncbi:MAG: hypothetical protein LBH96_02945 [Candidatus Peribacteria bacterium]|jgi:hypothetical protein|nr:hypothetical protein [Candidatus Peribacteria bacterium]